MSAEKRELALAGILGLLAGPCYLAAGATHFLALYAVVVFGGVVITGHWLREVHGSARLWLLWPVAMFTGLVPSLFVSILIRR
ncbi:MAG: hypothetical protein QXI12_10740 [Candidatus Methanomethyliaceae archaeon]